MSFVLENGGVPILRRRSTGLFGRTPKGAQDCFVSPQAAPLTAHNRERNHGNLHLTCELHRPRNLQDQGFTEASGCLQRDGEKVRSDREGLPAQSVDATQALNLSAGVSNPKV